MIDISDGLGRDAGRIARASGVVIELEATRIPLAQGSLNWDRAVRDGEDYELLVVSDDAFLPDSVRRLVPIGLARARNPGEPPGVWVTDPYGRRHEVSDWGWDHR
jgi:thiamine-monophosphate kinase